MALTPDRAELLRYLAEIGWPDFRRLSSATTSGHRAPAGESPAALEASAASAALPDAAPELARIADKVATCRRCPLCETRHLTVFGSGSPSARLMLVGEAPGAEEDRRGLPFVGAAGELLTKMIAAIELRREDTYIANIVKCRPPGNRDPESAEIQACRGYLESQIDLIRPQVLVALGRVAAQALLDSKSPVGKLRGSWWQVRGVPTRVTYHPAALLRDASLKRAAWDDLRQVSDRLHLPPA